MAFEWVYWLAGFLLLSIAVTYFFKKVFGWQTYFIISLVRSKRFLHWLDRLAKHKKFWNFIADLGLIIGFGLIAVDYRFAKPTNNLKKRILILVTGLAGLTIFNALLISSLFGANPLTKDVAWVFVLAADLFGFAGLALSALLFQGIDIIIKFFLAKQPCPGVAPIIPGVRIPGTDITPPLIEVIIAFLIILIVHEASHGILLRKAKLKVKSLGLLLLGFIPIGAFAEPDEKQFLKAKPLDQLRVLAVGSMANLITCFIVLLLFVAVVVPTVTPFYSSIESQRVKGVVIESVQEKTVYCGTEYPAPAYGLLAPGMLVKKVNGKDINSSAGLAVAKADEAIDKLVFEVDSNGLIKEIEVPLNELRLVGITVKDILIEGFQPPLTYYAIQFIVRLFAWTWLLNLMVAIVNFLPSIPFDGGMLAKIMLPDYLGFWKTSRKNKEKAISKFFLYLVIALLLINALPLFTAL